MVSESSESGARTATVSGACSFCTRDDKFVIHETPWCPRSFAQAWMDSNMGRTNEDGTYTIFCHPFRPVVVDELVLLVDVGDGADHPFAVWGRIVEAYPSGRATALVGLDPGYTYADPPVRDFGGSDQ